MKFHERRAAIRALAKSLHHEEGKIEVDDGAKISEVTPAPGMTAENGAYVAAWVWVPFADTALDQMPDCSVCQDDSEGSGGTVTWDAARNAWFCKECAEALPPPPAKVKGPHPDCPLCRAGL